MTRNNLGLIGAFSLLASTLSGCNSAPKEDPTYAGRCSVVTNAQGAQLLRVQDEYGTLMLHGNVTNRDGSILIAQNPHERDTGLQYVDEPLARANWVQLGENRTVIQFNTVTQNCTVKLAVSNDEEITQNVRMTGEFKKHPFFDSMPGEATVRVMNGEPLPETKFAPTAEQPARPTARPSATP